MPLQRSAGVAYSPTNPATGASTHLLLVYSIPGFHGEAKTDSADSSKNVKIIDTQKEVKENNSLLKRG